MIRFINIRHLAGERELFNDLSWHIKPGERVGLVGDNGTGKTTLLRMAVQECEPTDGEVIPRRSTRIGYLRQEIHTFEGKDTVIQEAMKAFAEEQAAEAEVHQLYDALSHTSEAEHTALLDRIHMLEKRIHHHDAGSAESDARKILGGLGFSVEECDRPLAEFSGGWQMRAHIARLLLEQPDVLLMDEPTNHLDIESIAWLEGFLADFPGALVVVSHDRYFLDRITTRTAWLTQKSLRNFSGNYSKFLVQREEEEALLQRRYDNQQEEIARVERFIERFRYKATKASAVQSRVKMLEKIERIELPAAARRVRLRIPEPMPCGRHVLQLRGMGKAYGENRVFRGVDLSIEKGDKIALVGPNGAGKSTLLKICAGVLDYEGERELHSKAVIEYFSQHRIDVLNPDNSALEEARPPGAAQTDEELRSILGCFLFTGDDVFKPVRVLSGGEKSRLAFARMLLRRGNLLLLDEPTNHLDISTREVLQTALREFPGTIVMISHDRYFIDSVCTKTIEVGGGDIIVHQGNYSDFLQRKGEGVDAEAALRGRGKKTEAARKQSRAFHPAGALAAIELANIDRKEERRSAAEERRERAKKLNALNQRIKSTQAQIEQLESRLAEIHALQADPEAYAAGKVTPQISNEGKTLERLVPKLLKEWEALVEEHQAVLESRGSEQQ